MTDKVPDWVLSEKYDVPPDPEQKKEDELRWEKIQNSQKVQCFCKIPTKDGMCDHEFQIDIDEFDKWLDSIGGAIEPAKDVKEDLSEGKKVPVHLKCPISAIFLKGRTE